VGELPADFVVHHSWPPGSRQPGRLGGVGGGTQCVRSHVADPDGLTGGSGSSRGCRRQGLTSTDATDEAAADLLCRVQLASGEGAGPVDERARAMITWNLSFE
jgi:hypothetical protein